jgi:hypothetical protein
MAYNAPQLQQSPLISENFVTIEAYVDTNGRVQDYRVLSNAKHLTEPPQLKNRLIFTTFRPATYMGRPTAGTAVLLFSKDRRGSQER